MQQVRERQKEEQVEALKREMQSGMVSSLNHQLKNVQTNFLRPMKPEQCLMISFVSF